MGFLSNIWDSIMNSSIIKGIGSWGTKTITKTSNKINNTIDNTLGTNLTEMMDPIASKPELNIKQNNTLNPIAKNETNIKPKEDTDLTIPKEEPIKENTKTKTPKEEPIEENTETTTPKEEPIEEDIHLDTPQPNIDYEKLLNKLWAREDKIRKETQEREDNAYVRAVRDMKNAGINPNLVGINPANSGGGMTSASNVLGTLPQAKTAEISKYQAELNAEINKYIAELNNMVKQGTATEGNITSIITSLIGTVGGIFGSMMR